jgi:hypothetical protein
VCVCVCVCVRACVRACVCAEQAIVCSVSRQQTSTPAHGRIGSPLLKRPPMCSAPSEPCLHLIGHTQTPTASHGIVRCLHVTGGWDDHSSDTHARLDEERAHLQKHWMRGVEYVCETWCRVRRCWWWYVFEYRKVRVFSSDGRSAPSAG